jgi:hypothetical protein
MGLSERAFGPAVGHAQREFSEVYTPIAVIAILLASLTSTAQAGEPVIHKCLDHGVPLWTTQECGKEAQIGEYRPPRQSSTAAADAAAMEAQTRAWSEAVARELSQRQAAYQEEQRRLAELATARQRAAEAAQRAAEEARLAAELASRAAVLGQLPYPWPYPYRPPHAPVLQPGYYRAPGHWGAHPHTPRPPRHHRGDRSDGGTPEAER